MSLSELRVFGRSGTPISPLTLGTMNFGEGTGTQGAPTGAEEGIRIIHAALDAGITAIDTADVYSQGESEQVVGRALRGRRDDVFLATKFHGQMSPNPAHSGNSRRWITQAVEAACAGCRRTGSTCTRRTGPTTTPTSWKPSPPLMT